MAGSATITGRQNYVLGIGHPKNEAPTEGAPAVFSADGKNLVGPDGLGADASGRSVYNLKESNTRQIRKMRANVQAGIARGRVLVIGDSTTAGAGAGTTSTTNCAGAFAKSYPNRMAAMLSSRGLPAQMKSMTGNQGITSQVTYQAYDPRVSAYGTGWSTSGIATLGGNGWLFTTGSGAGTLTLTETCTHFTVYHAQGISNGTATVTVDGGASLGTLSAVGSSLVATTFSAGSLGAHAIQINAQNNGNFFVPGIVCWDATAPAVDILQCAQYGATTAPFVVTGSIWSAKTMIGVYNPDLTVIQLGVNDSRTGLSVATYKANIESIVSAALATGDVLLMDFLPDNSVTPAVQAQYIEAVRQVAFANDIPYLSINERWGDLYSVGNALGYYFDDVHMTALGYAVEGDWLSNAALSA